MRPLRLLAAPLIAGAMVLAQAVGASPASAAANDLACNYDYVTFNACLHFELPDDYYVIAHVGLDRIMGQGYAEEILGNTVLTATLWVKVNGQDRFVTYLNLDPGWPAAGTAGFGAEWSGFATRSSLDVNTGAEDVFAKVSYFDPHDGSTWQRTTGIVRGDFFRFSGGGGGGGGGGGCVIVCP
jgi:hypothetical protein